MFLKLLIEICILKGYFFFVFGILITKNPWEISGSIIMCFPN